jgi:nicotinamidase-related amidase
MQGDHSEKRYHILGRKHTDDAGKRSAVKVACCVWRGAFGTGQQCTSLDAYPTDPPPSLLLPHATSPEPEDWSDILPALGSHPLDHLITKHQWGAFFGTDLDLQLRRRKIDTIVLCGIATNIGVETTAREAYQYGYNQIFATDAMNAYSEEEHQHTCTYILPRMGCIRSTDEIVAAISGKR